MTGKPQAPESPFLIERLMRETRRSMEQADFTSEEQFRETMQEFIDDGMQEKRMASLQDDPIEMAQELAFQAYEVDGAEPALELAERALVLDPECLDALSIKAFLTCEDAGELIAALEHAATCGERRLGEEFFAEFMGDFWPMVEARPYLRTIKELAEVLWTVGRRFDAVDHYQNLLDLDPADHMGNAALLLACYLSMGEVQRSWDLLEEYDDETTAVYQWAWVLCLLLTDDEEAALDALHHALECNPFVAPQLLELDVEEEEAPALVAPGSREEAVACGQILGDAWDHHPVAMEWLYDILIEMGVIEVEDDPDHPDHDPAPTRH